MILTDGIYTLWGLWRIFEGVANRMTNLQSYTNIIYMSVPEPERM